MKIVIFFLLEIIFSPFMAPVASWSCSKEKMETRWKDWSTEEDRSTCNVTISAYKKNTDFTPKCERPCQNGVCTKGNQCKCSNGYISLDDRFICIPVCDTDFILVQNGTCTKPNILRCNPGFQFAETDESKLTCVERCQPGCVNGICLRNGTCQCETGFRLKTGSTNECEPVCHLPCVANQKCIAPGVCQCLEGYAISNVSKNCVPICDNCTEECCLAPERCQCEMINLLVDYWVTIAAVIGTITIIAIITAVSCRISKKDVADEFVCKYIPSEEQNSFDDNMRYSRDPTTVKQSELLHYNKLHFSGVIKPNVIARPEQNLEASGVYDTISELHHEDKLYANC